MFSLKFFKRLILVVVLFPFCLNLQISLAGKYGAYEALQESIQSSDLDVSQLDSIKKLGLKAMKQLDVPQQQELLRLAEQMIIAMQDQRVHSESQSLSRELVPNSMNLEGTRLFALTLHLLQEVRAEESDSTHTNLSIEHGPTFDEDHLLTEHKVKASHCYQWKKKIAGSGVVVCAASCILGGYLLEDDWSRAVLLATAACLINTSVTFLGLSLPVPDEWGHFPKILVKALFGAFVRIPGTMLFFSSMQVGLEPESSVSLVALNSISAFSCSLFIVVGEMIFYDQPSNWPAWVGIAAFAGAATLQTWHAIEYPAEYGR